MIFFLLLSSPLLNTSRKYFKNKLNKVHHKNTDFVNYMFNLTNTLRNNSIKASDGNGYNEKITETKLKPVNRPTTSDKFRLSLPASNKILRTFPHF